MSSSLLRRRGNYSGPRARAGFLIVGTLGLFLACSNDDDAPAEPEMEPTGLRPDASTPELPGEGLEPTPDVTDREVTPVPSDRYIDSINGVLDALDPNRPSRSPGDAGSRDAGASDGAADGGP